MALCGCFGKGGHSTVGEEGWAGGADGLAESQNLSGEGRVLWRAGDKVNLALVGLDDAGKTSLLHSLQLPRDQRAAPSDSEGEGADRTSNLCAPPPTLSAQVGRRLDTAASGAAGLDLQPNPAALPFHFTRYRVKTQRLT